MGKRRLRQKTCASERQKYCDQTRYAHLEGVPVAHDQTLGSFAV
jgi:hypothetical protein